MNAILIVGNLTKDPIVRDGKYGKVCFFTVAVSNRRSDKADFFNVKAGGKQADACERYLCKGRSVCVRGSVHLSEYAGPQGDTRYQLSLSASDVEFLRGKETEVPEASPASGASEPADSGYREIEDDDLPF